MSLGRRDMAMGVRASVAGAVAALALPHPGQSILLPVQSAVTVANGLRGGNARVNAVGCLVLCSSA